MNMSILHKTGRICIAMLCAFSAIGGLPELGQGSACGGFVGSMASMVLALNTDGDGMTLEQYERLFGLDLTSPDNAFLDCDGDGLLNWEEAYQGTDPFQADTDADGWPDGGDNEISRARLDFHPIFTAGDSFSYFWPSWMVAASKAGGEWETSMSAWSVPAGTSGKLCLIVDRSLLTNDVVMEVEFYDAPNASLFVDLVNLNNETLISSELVGNPGRAPWPSLGHRRAGLIDGSGTIVRKAINIPLETYPEAVGIHLRGTGELFIFEGLLFVDLDNDGLDASQEIALGTSDLMSDSDGDGISDYDEIFIYGTNPAIFTGRANPQGEPTISIGRTESAVDGQDSGWLGETPRPTLSESGTKPQEFRTAKIKAITIPQFVQALMSGANFTMSRDTLDGGGTRQTSPAFIMEDSLGQSSAIGFSYGSNITLHAGYQQADDQRLEIWNVSAIPVEFNPTLGEWTTLSYALSTRSPRVTIEVYKPDMTNLLVDQVSQGAGLHTVVWDGTNATSGEWTFRIRAADYQGRVVTNETPTWIRSQIPVILSVSDAPDPFCPVTDGSAAISYTTAESQNRNLDVTITIEDAFGNPVTNFSAFNQTPGSYSYNWDGTGARNGLFIYRINARRGGQPANEKTGSIILACGTECVTNQDGNVQVCYQTNNFSIAITGAAPDQISEASRAVLTAEPGLLFQGGIYDIKAEPSTNFDPPAILTFKYDPTISGDIDAKLQIRRYDQAVTNWVVVAPQFVDYANHRIIAEVTNFSLHALVAVEQPAVLQAFVRLEPEALNVNPGILTAFVRLPEGYDPANITDATCDGAACERMMLSTAGGSASGGNDDGTEMIIKFRRQAIEKALAEIGEEIDTRFVLSITWQTEAETLIFKGTDTISKIVGE